MKRAVGRLCRITGAAMLIALSAAASAQSVTCDATTCSYGPICPDAWGGCYFYTWSIGSAKNTWTENRGGIANVVNLCDPNKPETCVTLESKVQLVTTEGGFNTLVFCRVPGGEDCKGNRCGGSPDSSGATFLNVVFNTSQKDPFTSKNCTKDDKDKGGVKCSKTNTLTGFENNPDLSAQYCANPNWIVDKWWPLNFTAISTVQGPASRQGGTVTTTATAHCRLLDPNFLPPNHPNYALSRDLAKNHLECTHLQDGNS